MNCEEANNFMSARLDRQISAIDEGTLAAHVQACPACEETARVLAGQDAQLRQVFAPDRERAEVVAARAISQIQRERRRRWRVPWMTILASAAAGFGLAVIILRPPGAGPRKQMPLPVSPAIGQLALATGSIEVLPRGQTTWQIMATGAKIERGTRLRTSDSARCELTMADGSTVRFNCATDALVEDQRSFQLSGGQMWSTVAKAEPPFTVQAAGATVTAVGTQFDVQCEPRKATVRVAEGSTQVAGKDDQVKVDAGQMVRIADGSVGQVDRTYDLLVATRWVNELLVLRGRDSQELNRRVNDMLAQLGETKVRELYEDEIRSLGDHCVIPLARYLESARSLGGGEAEKRQRASRILSDLAQPWAIPDLIKLLLHPDGQVRYDAAAALERLTGQDEGIRPEQWRKGGEPDRQGYERWQRWWQDNRQRYPSGPLVNE